MSLLKCQKAGLPGGGAYLLSIHCCLGYNHRLTSGGELIFPRFLRAFGLRGSRAFIQTRVSQGRASQLVSASGPWPGAVLRADASPDCRQRHHLHRDPRQRDQVAFPLNVATAQRHSGPELQDPRPIFLCPQVSGRTPFDCQVGFAFLGLLGFAHP